MESPFEILRAAPDGTKPGQPWFAAIAEQLLNETDLIVSGRPYRLGEIEVYYHGGAHEDPFAHRDPVQLTCGRWYFHRDGGSYRGGSFKGLDISFGPAGAFGGVLIRTIKGQRGAVINGCSLCVDHLLRRTGFADVAALAGEQGERSVWSEAGPLSLRPAGEPRRDQVLATARVGLTLKMMARDPTMPRFIMRRYRFLTDPTIKKGKVHTVIALHQAGRSVEEIGAMTRSPRQTILRYLAAYQEGLVQESFEPFGGRALKTADLCRLQGAWASAFDSEGSF